MSPILLLWALCILITCFKFLLIVSLGWILLLNYFFYTTAAVTHISPFDFFSAIKLIIIRLLNNILYNSKLFYYLLMERSIFFFSYFIPDSCEMKCSLKQAIYDSSAVLNISLQPINNV